MGFVFIWAELRTEGKPVYSISSSWHTNLGLAVAAKVWFCEPSMAVLKRYVVRRFVCKFRVGDCSYHVRFHPSHPNRYKSNWFNPITQSFTLHAHYNHDLASSASNPSSRRWFSPIKSLGLIPWSSYSLFLFHSFGDSFANVYSLLTFRHQLTAGSMFSVSGFDVILFLLLFGEENLKIQMKGVKALETPGASKDLHRLERHLQWLLN